MWKRLSDVNRLTIWSLAWPIAVEMLLQFLMGTADTLMVSRISNEAVSAVGLCNQVINAVNVLFMTINSGAGIVIAQELGAMREEQARRTAALALKANFVIGIVLSVFMNVSAAGLLRMMHTPAEVLPLATTYLSLVGSGTVVLSLYAAASAVIRNTGNTKGTMLISLGMNVVHLTMNSMLIFGLLGMPKWGIAGVAASTLISRTAALALSLVLLSRSFDPGFRKSDWFGKDRPLVDKIWRIGWPMSLNAASWNFTQTIIFAVVASMGAVPLSSFTYMNTIQSLPWLIGLSVAMASQIRAGHLYGAGRYEECYRNAYTALWTGLGYVVTFSLLLWVTGRAVLGWFTPDANVIRIAVPLLAVNVLLQPLKMINQAFAFSLNAIGDTRFTALNSVVSMWAVAAVCAYVFGIALGLGIVGVFAAMIADEALRGLMVAVRWKKRGRLPRAPSNAPVPGVSL